jgi:hypothetical protein
MDFKLLPLILLLAIVKGQGYCSSNKEPVIERPMTILLDDQTQVFPRPFVPPIYKHGSEFYPIDQSFSVQTLENELFKNTEFYKKHESNIKNRNIEVWVPNTDSINLDIKVLYFFRTTATVYRLVGITFQNENVTFQYATPYYYRSRHHSAAYHRWEGGNPAFKIKISLPNYENHSQFDFGKPIPDMHDAKYLDLQIKRD